MESMLIVVTFVSLVVALVMSLTAWRLAREERRRAAARVAVLSAAVGISPADLGIPQSMGDRFGAHALEPTKAPWAPAPLGAMSSLSIERTSAREPVSDERSNRESSDSRPFLGSASPPHASGGRQRALAVAATLLFVGLAAGLAWTWSGRDTGVASAATPGAPLGLVSLRHERQASRLAVSGLVRNPSTGHPVERLSAVVFLFDQQGTFVMSATAPVDFIKIGLGDESPFVVTLDAPAAVTRYRVSFRTDDGIVPHVDRRGAPPIAASVEHAASLQAK